ncbi:MAG TPA: L,D-transpeptidase family protein [Prosthecobacter sp.]|nr:L,D-transpeptidase family protein [Prosthecobacter sp.]
MISCSFRFLAASAALVLCVSCASTPEIQEPKPDHFWIGDGVSGSPRMVISLSQQRLYYFKGDKLVGASPVSTGREPGWTKTGSFRISQKDIDHRSSAYGSFVAADGTVVEDDVDARTDTPPPGTRFVGAEMHYFMRVIGAIGMHKGYLPGYPASHGCIRLPGKMAEIFFHATPLGTPVEVRAGPVHVREPIEAELAEAKKPKPAPAPAVAAANRTRPNAPGLRVYPRRYIQPPPSQMYSPRPKESARGSGWFFHHPSKPTVPRGTTLYLE